MITERCWESLQRLLLATTLVPGDVVELGCHSGCTSVRIAMMIVGQPKKLYAFDSFQGLPKPGAHDDPVIKEGACRSTKAALKRRFREAGLPLPIIRKGLFKDTLPHGLPPRIAFAFLDSDRYDSIRLSLQHVMPRMCPGGVIAIHDYADTRRFPGVMKACNEILGPLVADPPELGIFRP